MKHLLHGGAETERSRKTNKGVAMNKYEIEYRLHYNRFDFDTCCHVFEGKNKTDAIKYYKKIIFKKFN